MFLPLSRKEGKKERKKAHDNMQVGMARACSATVVSTPKRTRQNVDSICTSNIERSENAIEALYASAPLSQKRKSATKEKEYIPQMFGYGGFVFILPSYLSPQAMLPTSVLVKPKKSVPHEGKSKREVLSPVFVLSLPLYSVLGEARHWCRVPSASPLLLLWRSVRWNRTIPGLPSL